MPVLGIETSCDETGLALVSNGRIIGEQLASQVSIHALFGGVVPEIASREHLRIIHPLFTRLLEETGISADDIRGVAVARGPGLLGSLLVGMGFAKGLAQSLGVPLVGVNHLHAHLLAPGLERELTFPALGLLISGGHTHIYRIDSPLKFRLLGRTLDDAAGEAFDKVAKILNFPYPGGKQIDRLAGQGTPERKLFPRPYIDNDNLDFSFSGLKTAVANFVNANSHLRLPAMPESEDLGISEGHRRELADVMASFNFSVADTLRIKIERALDRHSEIKSIIVAGGVAANTMIRARLKDLAEGKGLELYLPSFSLCTDNAGMIAHTGEILLNSGYSHDAALEAIPRGKPVPEDFIRKSA